MTIEDNFRKFEYRPSRIAAGFDLRFVAEGKTLNGFCEDLSCEGIRALIDGFVVVGSLGRIIFGHSTGTLDLEAQVAYIDDFHVGFVFLFQSPWERGIINSLMASIHRSSSETGIVVYPNSDRECI